MAIVDCTCNDSWARQRYPLRFTWPTEVSYLGYVNQGLRESLRCELMHERSNMHVTMVQMPVVNTPQFS